MSIAWQDLKAITSCFTQTLWVCKEWTTALTNKSFLDFLMNKTLMVILRSQYYGNSWRAWIIPCAHWRKSKSLHISNYCFTNIFCRGVYSIRFYTFWYCSLNLQQNGAKLLKITPWQKVTTYVTWTARVDSLDVDFFDLRIFVKVFIKKAKVALWRGFGVSGNICRTQV